MRLKADPIDQLIDRALEQREICVERNLHTMAVTFNDLARYLVGLKLATEL